MNKIAVLGAGMVGSAIAIDLSSVSSVTSIDVSESALRRLHANNKHIDALQKNLADYESYEEFLKPFDFIVTAVPGFMGFKTLEAVIKAKKNVVDISFFPENALDLDEIAKQNNVKAIVDCGVAPGMSNLILGYHNARMQVEEFECMVGGLPKKRIQPFEYKAPFSPIDVIEEYTRPARYVENGQLVTKQALSDSELIDFDKVGTLESFNTDGLRSLLYTMKHIPDMKEKTLRYPGHIQLMKALIKGGFFDEKKVQVNGNLISPLEFSSSILFNQWKLEAGEDEFTIMRIKISGKEFNDTNKQIPVRKNITYSLYDEYDRPTKTSSMARTTGYTCAAAVHLLMKDLVTENGILPPEFIGKNETCFHFILQYLRDRNVVYQVT